MIWWPFFFMSSLLAQEQVLIKYCFNGLSDRMSAYRALQTIIVPSDEVIAESNCLNYKMYPHRRELVSNFLNSTKIEHNQSDLSAQVGKELCELKIEKMKTSTKNDVSLINALEKNFNSNETITISTLREFEFSYSSKIIKGYCQFAGRDRYLIELRMDDRTDSLSTKIQLNSTQKVEVSSLVRSLIDKVEKADLAAAPVLSEKLNDAEEIVYLSINAKIN